MTSGSCCDVIAKVGRMTGDHKCHNSFNQLSKVENDVVPRSCYEGLFDCVVCPQSSVVKMFLEIMIGSLLPGDARPRD